MPQQHRPGARRTDGRQRTQPGGHGLAAARAGVADRLASVMPTGDRHLSWRAAPGGGGGWIRRNTAGG